MYRLAVRRDIYLRIITQPPAIVRACKTFLCSLTKLITPVDRPPVRDVRLLYAINYYD